MDDPFDITGMVAFQRQLIADLQEHGPTSAVEMHGVLVTRGKVFDAYSGWASAITERARKDKS